MTDKWNGQGLPPVGEVCEFEYAPEVWCRGECIAHHLEGAVLEEKGRYYHCFADRVRPSNPKQNASGMRRSNLLILNTATGLEVKTKTGLALLNICMTSATAKSTS